MNYFYVFYLSPFCTYFACLKPQTSRFVIITTTTIVRFYCMAFPTDRNNFFPVQHMDLKICSLNVRGLGDKLKRREMFNWLRRKYYSIYMLQEMHCSENTISVWSAEWGYKALFSCCTSAKGGVAILFNNNFDLQLLRTYLDPNGRFIICDITAEKKCMTIATLCT